jgi:hypothetical protein
VTRAEFSTLSLAVLLNKFGTLRSCIWPLPDLKTWPTFCLVSYSLSEACNLNECEYECYSELALIKRHLLWCDI